MSLTNEPEKLANTALDTLSHVLNIECCWIQTIKDRRNQQLLLAAELGFSDEIRREVAAMNLRHSFSEQIIGLGRKIVIPDLNNDGAYGLSSFRNSGYRWLVAVPLMTYRVHGILGTASRNRKILQKETADLIMVIAGLIASALSKAHLSISSTVSKKPLANPDRAPEENTKTSDNKTGETLEITSSSLLSEKNIRKDTDASFHNHARKMESFRQTH